MSRTFYPLIRKNRISVVYLYYYKRAIKAKDEKAKEKYFDLYLKLGGSEKDIEASIERSAPPMPDNLFQKDERLLTEAEIELNDKWAASITPRKKEMLILARQWYEQIYNY